MKKLFFFIPALLLSLLVNAKEILIGSETSNIIHYTIAASSTSDGDVIVLTDAGPYVNSKANSDDYTKIAKNVTIKAADGIQPVIKFEVPIQARDGKSGKFIGIKFDGSTLQYDHFVYVKDDSDNELEFENCEFYNSSKYIVSVPSSTKAKSLVFKNCKFYNNSTNRGILNQGNIGHLGIYDCEFSDFVKDVIDGYSGTSHVDSCIVNNCYFHNNSRSAILFNASTVEGQQTCDKFVVKNSTFANINASGEYTSVIDIRPYGTAITDAIKVEVDHCTFYNNTVINSDHANIRTAYLSDVTVSNCIFYYPSEYPTRATYCTGGGNINNCLTYNYTAEGTKGHAYGATVNAASVVADPLFDDLANNKYTFAGNWVTMNFSPARGAATDGSDLGDPRWYTAETLPSTDFASPYAFVGEKAIVSNSMELDANNYIHSKSSGGSAIWKIHSTRACDVEVTLNMDPDGNVIGHNYQVEIFDADGNSIGTLDEGGWQSNVDDKVLSGKFHFPAEGDYKIELTNSISGTTSTIKGITLTFAGGAVFDIPTTLLPVDATISQYAEINGDEELVFSTKDWLVTEQYGKWNIHVEKGGDYAFQLNAKSTNSHSYKVSILTANESETLQYFEKAGSSGNDLSATEVLTLAPGDYVVMVQNTTNYSAGRLVNIIITYKGGARITLPATCDFADFILSEKAHITAGELWFNTIGDSNPVGQWAKWNVKVAEAGTFLFTMNVSSTNGQSYKISILDGETEIDAFESGSVGTGDKTVKHYFNLAAGNYTVKLENTYAWSQGHIVSLDVTQPSLLVIDEAATSNTVIHNNYRNGNHDIQIIRTITSGMYNTICLPFDVSSSQLPAIFGSDVDLRQMESATLSDDVLTLNFDAATSIYRGTPYLIKTSSNVVNPVFTDVEIKAETGQATSGDNADFIGSFIKGTVPAGEDNLFLGANDLLYFSEAATTIKGMRAYFQIHDVPSGAPVRQARIVAQGNVVTALEFVNGEWQEVKSANGTIKTIENEQLILIRDGKRYNVMGVRF